MSNKYVRGLVTVVVGIVILVALLFIGDQIAVARGASPSLTWSVPDKGILAWWLFWVIVGAVILYLIYVFFAESEMFKISTREVVMMALGAALYGVLAWVFNIVPVPSVSLVALRPVVVIPIFFGFVFGPAVGFFTGAFGNVLGDALTGWGVFPIWDIGNGLMGLIPGLAGLYLMKKAGDQGRLNILQWIAIAVLAVGVVLPLISPNITDPFSGNPANFGAWWYIMLVVLVVMVGLTFAPQYWPYILLLLTAAFLVLGILFVMGVVTASPSAPAGSPLVGAIVMWVIAVLCGGAAWFVNSRVKAIGKWMDDQDTKTLVIWASIGVIVGIGFAAMADIFYNGYSFTTAFIGEFIPAAGPNVLFAVILTPLLYAAYKQARTGMGR